MITLTSRMLIAAAQELHRLDLAKALRPGADIAWDRLTNSARGQYVRDATAVMSAGLAQQPSSP